jgi:four helix bundle protein
MDDRKFQNSKQNNCSSQGVRSTAYGERKGASHERRGGNETQSNDSTSNRLQDQAASPAISENKIKTFKELLIWQKGLALVKKIYQITRSFPREEVYGLAAQMKRCAISVPSNIAEGFRRRHSKEFKQFLNIGLGSLAELETQVLISGELTFVAGDVKGALLEEIDHLTAMMICLSKKM